MSVVLPALFECFKSNQAEIRKAVVFCLVDIWAALGDEFTPFLSQLGSPQYKLVQIYYNRRVQGNENFDANKQISH
jgi:CLIP-associating protein 1/2